MSSTTPRLPQELCDYVLDHLWDDHRALAACSLTSRKWLHTTRQHMFHTLRFTSNLKQGFREYLALSLYIARYVRCLILESCYFLVGPAGAWVTQNHWRAYFPMVETLEIGGGIMEDLPAFLTAFPQLSRLRFGNFDWIKRSPNRIQPTMFKPKVIIIKELSLYLTRSSVIHWLVDGPFSLCLRSLHIWLGKFASAASVNKLLHAAGRTLEDLCVYFSNDFFRTWRLPDEEDLPVPDCGLRALTFSTELKSISFERISVFREEAAQSTVDYLSAALQSLRSTKIREIKMCIVLNDTKQGQENLTRGPTQEVMKCVDVLGWVEIDGALEKIALERDRLLVIVVLDIFDYDGVQFYGSHSGVNWQAEMTNEIVKRMPLVSKRKNVILGTTIATSKVEQGDKESVEIDVDSRQEETQWFSAGQRVEEPLMESYRKW